MTRRAVVALLTPVRWAPPGVPLEAWRAALVEDAVDLLATLAQVEPAIAAVRADLPLAAAVAWPGMPVYEVPSATAAQALAAATDGYDQAAVLAIDAPDVPGLVVGKLLRPLTTRPVAVAPALDGPGLLGVAARLPAPDWLPEIDLDSTTVDAVRQAAPQPGLVAAAPGWRRLRGPAQFATLDPAIEGWDNTRLLLS
jgi:hypothetical protein